MQLIEATYSDFLISTDKSKLDVIYIHQYLNRESYWAAGIPIEIVTKSIANSLCFGVYHEKQQVGFARMITDGATFAYLADVFIDEKYRGQGLSKRLMQVIKEHPDLQGLRRMLLATRDAHGLYAQFGFTPLLSDADNFMQIKAVDVYKKG
ncbi:GNAT family N-acetyltransferase [Solitalea longa]|uniref:GNAT family N-acetyltransferase n=1 Tax=Solitalea longa TaxID=2079460 RepID=A0A2S5A733_9SPHI|nr:GNAT family N-acetyltransferase [Solitalea longa]POY38355.1 GNAT family N-acetyltransferase [Solitalea longa]